MNSIPARRSTTVPYEKWTEIGLWLGVAVVVAYHLGLELATIRLQEPMGFWETVYAARAEVWPHQYQIGNYINGHDGYGPGYPAFVRPFLWLGIDVYVAHRLANLVAILSSCALIFWLLRQQRCSHFMAASLTAIIFALNAGSYSIQARPDFLVLLLITALLALGDAVARHRLKLSAGFAVAITLLAFGAFLTKAYSAFTFVTVLAFTLSIDWRRALGLSLLSAAAMGTGIWVYSRCNPYYAMEVFHGQALQAAPDFIWFRQQWTDFAVLTFGLVAVIMLSGLRNLSPAQSEADQSNQSAPATRQYWWWQSGVAIVGLLAGPAWHTGAYLTYFFHLLLVPLAVLTGNLAASAAPRRLIWTRLALLANLAVLMLTAPNWLFRDESWDELRADILKQPGRVALDYIMEPIAREKPDAILLGSGMTGYALKEAFLIKHKSEFVQAARDESQTYLSSLSKDVFGKRPADTIYLDCLLSEVPGSASGFTAIPRNEIPLFSGPEMAQYVAVGWFNIAPYYFATNAPRQKAGLAKTTIVKFVRRPSSP
jgi:hypothetical protein